MAVDISGLKTDVTYVKSRIAGSEEIAVMNENIAAIRNHLDI